VPKRKASRLLLLKVTDYPPFNVDHSRLGTANLTIWNPGDDFLQQIKEGHRFKVLLLY
jgi:hypothetical protein